jgi:N-acetylglucosaminyl-diphospho-decaprenol L-rhamnosyltransferase
MALSDVRQRALAEPVVSIVIVHHDAPHLLHDCLAAIPAAAEATPVEIIVVDDASSRRDRPDLRPRRGLSVVRNEVAAGFAAAANQGAWLARGDHVLFLDPAVVLTSGSIATVLDVLTHDSRLAAVAPVNADDGHCAMRFLTAFNHTLLLVGWRRRREVVATTAESAGGPADWAERSTLLVRAEAFRAIGGFDEGYFSIGADEDWCWRAARRGYRIAIAHAVHTFRARAADDDSAQPALYRAHLRFLRRRAGIGATWTYRCGVSLVLLLNGVNARIKSVHGRSDEPGGTLALLRCLWTRSSPSEA